MTPPALPHARTRPLTLRHGVLIAEALMMLGGASVMIAVLPFRRVAALSGARLARGGPVDDDIGLDEAGIDRVGQAVRGWARRVPWRAVCFQQGLAVHLMLRRRGVASLLHYGVATDEARKLGAHVWVSVAGRTIVGAEEAPRFACLATFGGEKSGGQDGNGTTA